jgi:hypothetical protein
MPFFIVKVARTGSLTVIHTFPDTPLAGAYTYGRAQAKLRELRRSARPQDGLYFHLVYGATPEEALQRLRAALGR